MVKEQVTNQWWESETRKENEEAEIREIVAEVLDTSPKNIPLDRPITSLCTEEQLTKVYEEGKRHSYYLDGDGVRELPDEYTTIENLAKRAAINRDFNMGGHLFG